MHLVPWVKSQTLQPPASFSPERSSSDSVCCSLQTLVNLHIFCADL
uniref:Uncharacterized protein n=1 Tax=Anguilla anguilla TaxID=7936 RepID=A0A0E9V3G7_ANGAN